MIENGTNAQSSSSATRLHLPILAEVHWHVNSTCQMLHAYSIEFDAKKLLVKGHHTNTYSSNADLRGWFVCMFGWPAWFNEEDHADVQSIHGNLDGNVDYPC